MTASAPLGVAYFLWRRTRWTLAAVLGIVLLMGLVTRVASPTYQGPLTVALTFLLLGVGTLRWSGWRRVWRFRSSPSRDM
jgi:hypothetical protein